MGMTHYRRLSEARYVLVQSLALTIGGENAVTQVEVPAGFAFDVSVPRLLRWWIDPHDERLLKAAALHDYALHRLGWPREVAAAPFGHCLREAGVSRGKRLAMIVAVIVWRWN